MQIYSNLKQILCGVNNQILFANREFNNFDQTTRKWTKTTYTTENLRNSLLNTYNLTNNLTDSLSNVNIDNYYASFPNFNDIHMYGVFKDIELNSDCCEFRIMGQLGRDAGQLVNLSSANKSLKTNINGGWFIYRMLAYMGRKTIL